MTFRSEKILPRFVASVRTLRLVLETLSSDWLKQEKKKTKNKKEERTELVPGAVHSPPTLRAEGPSGSPGAGALQAGGSTPRGAGVSSEGMKASWRTTAPVPTLMEVSGRPQNVNRW